MSTKDYNREHRLVLVFLVKLIRAEGKDVTARINRIAKERGISSATLRRWEHRFDEKGAGELRRQARSDRGLSRANCKWVVEFVLASAKKRPVPTHNQIYRSLKDEVKAKGAEFCESCFCADSCKMAGSGIRLGSRHSINRIVSCANLTISGKRPKGV